MRVLHVLHHSAPYLDGYGVRSKYIVDFQRRLGLTPIVVTSAHHEIEINRDPAAFKATEAIDGTDYVRTPIPNGAGASLRLRTPFLREQALVSALRGTLEGTLGTCDVDLVHAHSPVLCGRPALEAARRRGIPMVYEIRAFWEDAFLLDAGRFGVAAAKYRYSRSLETRLMGDVDAVVAISQHMLDDIESRGIPAHKLHKMPNGVDVEAFAPMPRDAALGTKLGVEPEAVVGFIGTFFGFEGLDCLVNAMPIILRAIPNAKLLLVGAGPEADRIRTQVSDLNLQGCVIQTGRVKHEEVARYYSVMDLLVYPRHRSRLTELVTPLKPLEAMALGKAVVGSDVGGIAELLDNGRAGRLFAAGDANQLAAAVIALLRNRGERERLAGDGRRYALETRSWATLVPGYLPLYHRLVSQSSRRAS